MGRSRSAVFAPGHPGGDAQRGGEGGLRPTGAQPGRPGRRGDRAVACDISRPALFDVTFVFRISRFL